MTTPYLSDIFVYPVKSLGGIRVSQWPVTATGLQYDRHWLIVDEQQQFLSQRRLPRMVLINSSLTEQHLLLNAPNMHTLEIGLEEHLDAHIAVQVWEDHCQAVRVSAQADQWLSEFLQAPCHLVKQLASEIRRVDPQYALASDQTSFSDGFPFLLAGNSSLDALNQHLASAIDMQRFRPNLVISGCAPYAEDSWREISINDIHFRLPKPCSRCPVPTVDPSTGEYGKEPLTTLNKLRKTNNKVYFGQNALHDSLGILHCGAAVRILKTGPNQPLLA